MSYMSTVIADGAVGFWELSESAGPTATDQAGNSNGTYTVNLNFSVLGIPGGGALSGISQGGSSGGYVSIPDVAAQHVGDTFTLEMWTKRAGTGVTRFFGGANASTPGLQFDSSDHVQFNKQSVSAIASSTTTITDTNWHHIVATKSGSTVHIYIDGTDVTGSVTNSTMSNTSSGWFILKDNNNSNFPAAGTAFQFVAIYPTALNSTAVANHYSLGSTGTPPSNDSAPVASGTPLVGQTLTSTAGSWTDDGTGAFTFQWQRDNLGGLTYGNIGGATSSAYAVQTNDYQCNLRCVVTDTEGSGAGAVSANSNAIGLVTLRQRIGIQILT